MRRIGVVIERDPPGRYVARFAGLTPHDRADGRSPNEALGRLIRGQGYLVELLLNVQFVTPESRPMSGVSPRSVQQPATAEDLFDQLGNVATLRAQLAPLGLLDPAITAAIDAVEARIADHLARTIKFDPGARVRLVRHGDALYAYDERDGQPSFEVVEPVDAAEIDLEQAPIPAPAE